MQAYNILIGCDQQYYSEWGHTLLESIYNKNPWLENYLHCHIVNPADFNPLPYVVYTTENRSFASEDSKISYLQSVRFLKVADKIDRNNLFVTLDADTVCTRSFTKEEFSTVFKQINVLQHRKSKHWLAGFVTFNNVEFAKEYAKLLTNDPIDVWEYGRDQYILAQISKRYAFQVIDNKWIYYGKSAHGSVFYTLKGTQKIKDKYLNVFNKFKE